MQVYVCMPLCRWHPVYQCVCQCRCACDCLYAGGTLFVSVYVSVGVRVYATVKVAPLFVSAYISVGVRVTDSV